MATLRTTSLIGMLVPTMLETQVDLICAHLATFGGVRVDEYPVGSSVYGFAVQTEWFFTPGAVGPVADSIRSVRSSTTGAWPYLLNVTEQQSGSVHVKFEVVG